MRSRLHKVPNELVRIEENSVFQIGIGHIGR